MQTELTIKQITELFFWVNVPKNVKIKW